MTDHILADLNAASDLIEKSEHPICAYCGALSGLRVKADGGMSAFGFRIQPAEYTCEGCFTGTDTGPSFDDLPVAEEFPL